MNYDRTKLQYLPRKWLAAAKNYLKRRINDSNYLTVKNQSTSSSRLA